MRELKKAYPLTIISLFILFNPQINLIDIFPDVIAYIFLIIAIGNFSKTIPYFAECKATLVKLSIVSAIKIPTFAIMYANLKTGSDIIPMFTLSFGALELILIYSAIKNLTAALSYVGERTDCKPVFEPYKDRGLISDFDSLKVFTYIFFAIRAALNLIPELLLLTVKDTALKMKLREAYPAILIICILMSLVLCIIWLRNALKYARSINTNNALINAVSEISSCTSAPMTDSEIILKRITKELALLAISGIFFFDLAFQDMGGYNILPHFIYGIILFCSVYSMQNDKRIKLLLTASTVCFSLASIVNQTYLSRFFSRYQYTDLSYSKAALEAYLPIKLASVFETVFLMVILVIAAISTVGFIKEHTDVLPTDQSYSSSNKKTHKRLIGNTLPVFILAGVISILKCAAVFLKESVRVIYSEANPDGIITSAIPYMDTLIFFITLIYVIYSFFTVSNLKDEVKFKYGRNF